MLKVHSPMTAQSNPLILEISPTVITEAEALFNTQASAIAKWTAYHHHIAQQTLKQWLQTHSPAMAHSWFTPAEEATIWEQIPGVALNWGEVRIALFATEVEGEMMLNVPQEWVDLPTLIADYYLMTELHISSTDSWLMVVGYVTHQELKTRGQYQAAERLYTLPCEQLVADFTLLLLGQQLWGQRRVSVPAIAPLSADVGAALLQTCLAQSEPRLTLPFEQWGALFSDVAWRQDLYDLRLAATGERQKPLIALHQWLHHLETEVQQALTTGWQTLENIATQLQSSESILAYRFGGDFRRPTANQFPQAVPGILEVLRSTNDKETLLSALYFLGQVGQGDADAIATLLELQNTTNDVEIRRQAAVSLGKIDPTHPAAGVRRAKVIDLGLRLNASPLILFLTLFPDAQETNIQVRISPAQDGATLPVGLKLSIIDEHGNLLQEEMARSRDLGLQIAFAAEPNDQFGVQVALAGECFTEYFTV